MNLSIYKLNDKNEIFGGPLIPSHNHLSINKCNINKFSVPFCYHTQKLELYNSFFSYFLSQVIKRTKNDKDYTTIRCNIFTNIKTSEKGSVFSLESSKLLVEYCRFANITTATFPACFYAKQCDTIINHCTFSYCSGEGGNECFGNGFYCYQCNNRVTSCSVLYCGIQKSPSGDTAIALVASCGSIVSYINSTKCYGENGAASVSVRKGTAETNYLSYLMVTEVFEHNAIEFTDSKTSYLKLSCVINSTNCIEFVLNNLRAHMLICQNCTFLNPFRILFQNPSATTLEFCYSSNHEMCEECYPIYDNDNLQYFVPIEVLFMCGTCRIRKSIFSISFNVFMIINLLFIDC